MINKELMKDRVRVYGNNFPAYAELLSKSLGIPITPSMAARMLALLKFTRIEDTSAKLAKAQQGTELYFALLKHKEDSVTDYENYLWISEHYEEYEALVN